MKWSARIGPRGWHLLGSSRGSVAIHLAILLAGLIGMAALGAEITFAIYKHRQEQSAADSAALSAATALTVGHPTDPAVEARAIAASAGFVNGVDNATITVNHPPSSGPNAGNQRAVEVLVSQTQDLTLVSLFQSGLFTITARAVAIQGTSAYCVLALDTSAAGAITLNNNAIVSNPLCGVAANSTNSRALVVNNNAEVKGPVSVRGNWWLGGGARLSGHPLISNGPTIVDPYAGIGLQTIPPCTTQRGSGGNTATFYLSPGHFCSGWNFSNNVTLNLAPGAYYIDQQLSLSNTVTVNGMGGVTLIVDGDYAINIGNNAVLSITAPVTGPYAGLAFFGLRTATPAVRQVFSNNVTMNIKGAVYFPNQIVEFDNNGSTTPGGCTQVIARIVNIRNTVELDNNCSGTGAPPVGNASPHLVE